MRRQEQGGGRGGATDGRDQAAADPAGAAAARAAEWWRDAVVYQLHPKSFMDGNDDGTGDFAGLLARLDHVAELGADAIWLLPFYPSPRRDDGYDIADYTDVHPDYGTLAAFRRFVEAAHARGLKVITELVLNHTSSDHPWFQRARRAPKGSWQRDFYVWSDDDSRYAGTRVVFCDVEPSNWTWDPLAGQYYWHRFYSHQPDLNFDNPRVLAAMLRVMRFWAGLGVDGFRLDAVSYLVEREGTTNDNLPETHAILKRLRAELERHHPGRMLVAEANLWPEDVRAYFGDGDECHMCFHFPLMPRMYMAVAQEDRFPVTDILRQTPDLPAGCQWAVFLRNHDELTLEMVTDAERDALWSVYAADARARLNLGIRRRLAPLMERDRRRIELMKGLLLSMPGTPVIYYGDEIGMGDNVYLKDRDGVRTPMQWSPDRNGGFSRADPAALVLPVIQDPLYGFQAVNVEAQARDPSSLLNWTKRMLAVRRRSRAFGRGAMRLLYPGNRKVLAYLREHDGDTILCVFNLARTAQAVELDLAEFAGRVPVEMLGGTPFPPVGPLPYVLTLPPYGFHWFVLAEGAALPPWHVPLPEPLPELRTLVLPPRGGGGALPAEARAVLEREVLPAWLRLRHWHRAGAGAGAGGGGGRGADPAAGARLLHATPLPGAPGLLLAEAETDGATWQLPLARVPETEAARPAGGLALARLRQGGRVELLTDALATEAFPRAVLAALRDGLTLPGEAGEIAFRAAPGAAAALAALDPAALDARPLAGARSGGLVALGDAAVLKLLRRVEAGPHAGAEMARHLARLGFAGMPQPLGEVVRVAPDGTPHALMLATGFVRHQGDAWGWTLDWLDRAVEAAALAGGASEEWLAGWRPLGEAIGRRLAELHLLLARPSEDPAFAPEPADPAAWATEAAGIVAAALDRLAGPGLPPLGEAEADAAWLLGHRAALPAALRAAAAAWGEEAQATRRHGAFHLGQVLVAGGDALLVDFAGDPALPPAARRAKGPALADLAGLLGSLDYAAAVTVAEGSGAAAAASGARRAAMVAAWRAAAGQAVSGAYAEAWRAARGTPWPAPGALDLLLARQAAAQALDEAANRPAWLPVPVVSLATVARRLLAEG